MRDLKQLFKSYATRAFISLQKYINKKEIKRRRTYDAALNTTMRSERWTYVGAQCKRRQTEEYNRQQAR